MYLSEVYIENFRIFGAEEEKKHLRLKLGPGLNVFVGENDSGKSAIVDATRHVLWTTSQDYHRLTEDDFHVAGSERAKTLTISCLFHGLSTQESARFLEWLSMEDNKSCLYVTLKATFLGDESAVSRRGRNISVTVHSGKKGDGRAIEGEIREFLKVTYLRPLRDAEAELAEGRGSRLSQILHAHPRFTDQRISDFDKDDLSKKPKTLVGIMRQAEHLIQENAVIQGTKETLNTKYLKDFSIGKDMLEGEISVAKQADLSHILEKLELWLRSKEGIDLKTRRGLGVNNVLFMSTELLLLGGGEKCALPLLLIEEPEAHLHPQMQLRLMDFLEDKANHEGNRVQIMVTTHSPNLVSKVDLESVVVMNEGKTYPLASEFTKLEPTDYRFLRRFLDVTKANLFFAKGVMIVEGDAENIILPTLAKLLGRSFSENGVSIVNVGSRGLFRYSRIFQRKDGEAMPIRVACIADRDIPSDAAVYTDRKKESEHEAAEIKEIITKLKENDSGHVQTFVSPKWTLEHDLAYCGLAPCVHASIQLAKKAKNKSGCLSEEEKKSTVNNALKTYKCWKKEGLTTDEIAAKIYEPLYKKQASKAETAQFLAELLDKLRPSPERMRSRLPGYVVEAIDFVTGYSEIEEH